MLENLLELRKRLWRCLLGFGIGFALCFYYANTLYLLLLRPLIIRLPEHAHLIASNITSAVFTPLQLALHMAFLLSMPVVLWQIWSFVAPGLYLREKRPLRQAILLSWGLFLAGVAFGYFIALPLLFSFFIQALPQEVQLLPDMRLTQEFIIKMLIIFGVSFQVPLVCALLVRVQLLRVEQLITIRPYAIVLAFILGMLLTPPDVISQIILALPLCILYELGILLARLFTPKKSDACTGNTLCR